jgi:hypothetical protein
MSEVAAGPAERPSKNLASARVQAVTRELAGCKLDLFLTILCSFLKGGGLVFVCLGERD